MKTLIDSVRQNHALEHATMNILNRRHPYLRLMGRSALSGFYLYGVVDTQELANAVSEALVRLQQGETHLAIHPRCGTNLAVTSVLAGAAAFGTTLGRPRSRFERLPWALIAATLAAILAQPLAYKIQEQVTTNPKVEGLYISEICRQEKGRVVIHKVTVGRQ